MTIRHVVSWKLASTDPRERAEQAQLVKSKLEGLPPLVGEIRSLQVGLDSTGSDDNFDVVLIADFDDLDGLAGYIANPDHKVAAAYIQSVVGGRSAVDFEV